MGRRRALGTDISRWQGAIDFEKMRLAGASFTFIKASQGKFTDGNFYKNWAAAKESGIYRGAYHFYDLRSSGGKPEEQADYFAEELNGDIGNLPPVLDFESPGVSDYPPLPYHDESVDIVMRFCKRFRKKTKFMPMIYTNGVGIQCLSPLNSYLKGLDLWIAWYSTEYHTPRHYEWPDWRFWQYKCKGDGPAFGVESTSLDMNVFNGTEENLKDYVTMLGQIR